MPIQQSDLKIYLSGGAANTNPAASLGGARSNTLAGSNLWDTVGSAEAAAGDTEYRCLYVRNEHASITWTGPKLWVNGNSDPDNLAYEVAAGSSAVNGTEQTVADEGTAPTGVTFVAAVNKAGGVALPDLAPGQAKAFWFKRVADASLPGANYTWALVVEGDTLP
jgi:hypothetical protein